jgi:hypothetical protein
MLEIARFKDEDDDVYLSFWYYGAIDGRLSWRRRFQVGWKIFRHGRGHPDHLVFADPQRKALIQALLNDGEILSRFNSSVSTNSVTSPPTTTTVGTVT